MKYFRENGNRIHASDRLLVARSFSSRLGAAFFSGTLIVESQQPIAYGLGYGITFA